MFERDYIMRLVQQVVQALARMKALRKEGRLEDADQELINTGEALLGARPEVFLAMPEEEVVGLFTSAGQLDVGKAAVLARLWAEQAELLFELGKPGAALSRRLRALGLWTQLEERGATQALLPHVECRHAVVSALAAHEPLADIALSLHRHECALGNFANAEDKLYQARALGAVCYEIGLLFYERLGALDDATLLHGNLPRDEVQSGVEAWRTAST